MKIEFCLTACQQEKLTLTSKRVLVMIRMEIDEFIPYKKMFL
jgi:hypothetical protein